MLKLIEVARFSEDVAATSAFYQQLLGSEPCFQMEGMTEFQLGEATLRIHRTYQPGEGELPPEDHLAFEVENLEAACAEAEKSGMTIEHPPREYDWGKSAYLRDPDGRLVELHEG